MNARLGKQVSSCSRSFRTFAAMLSGDREELALGVLGARWREHYHGVFSELDRLLLDETRAGRRPDDSLLAISVSHHNLHRLFEVLVLEIGSARLSTSQVPERIADLVEVVSRLEKLLQTVSAPMKKEPLHA